MSVLTDALTKVKSRIIGNTPKITDYNNLGIIVLAAGKGTRMKSALAKVLHQINGVPLLLKVLDTANSLTNCANDTDDLAKKPHTETVVVLKHEADEITSKLGTEFESRGVKTTIQSDIPGTGSGALAGLEKLSDDILTVLVLSGDVPLLSGETVRGLIKTHTNSENAITILTAKTPNPYGYGRIVRSSDNNSVVEAIVEEKDATDAQRRISEINSGTYCFKASVLRELLPKVDRDNAQGEMYLTDVISLAVAGGESVGAYITDDLAQIEGVNDRAQLATLARVENNAKLQELMQNGVTIIDPNSTWIENSVKIENDVIIEPNCYITGKTTIKSGAQILLGSRIIDATVGENAMVGPYAFLRPNANLHGNTKVGAFVEVKNSTLNMGAKVPHLSYVGDAEIGENTNVGAGSIFANYDGVNKHQTKIGANSKIGSKTVLVAPVEVGNNVYTGAASLIRHNVPDNALAFSKTEQVTWDNWVSEHR